MVGKAIRRVRKRRGVSQSELADRLDVYQATISKWERGDRDVSEDRLQDVADALGVDTEEIKGIAKELYAEAGQEAEPEYVSEEKEISRWRDRVISDPSLDEWTQVLLMGLPVFLDRKSWVAPITQEQYVRETGRSKEMVQSSWDEMLKTPYVERIGENEWTLRLRFPKGE